MHTISLTTQTGNVNQNGQVTIRNTQQSGTDNLQYIYQLVCSHCGHNYGLPTAATFMSASDPSARTGSRVYLSHFNDGEERG